MNTSLDNVSYWESIYSQKRHLNLYPFDEVVSVVFSNFGMNLKNKKVLELGCGAGNNLWFTARHGAQVVGTDGSESAIKFCKKRFFDEKLEGEFKVQSFEDIKDLSADFDLIIDRAALTTTNFGTVKNAYQKIFKGLKSGGIFYSQLYSSASNLDGDYSNGVYQNLRGLLEDCGDIAVFNEKEVYELISDNKIISLRHTLQNEIDGNAEQNKFAHWTIVLQKV
jgi:SAM-dependent methyltransferase